MSTMHRRRVVSDVHIKRGLPKIGGSEGGFIAVIVCLALVIVISCTAVFFLLRNHEPSDQERAYRQRTRRHQHQTVPSSSYDAPAAPNVQSLQGKLAGMFRFGTKDQGTRSGGGGWTRTGSGDEWDYDSGDEGGRGRGLGVLREREMGQNVRDVPNAGPSPGTPFTPPTSVSYRSIDSASSIPVDLHAAGQSYFDSYGVPLADPHAVRPAMYSTQLLPSPTTSSPPSSPPHRTASPMAISESNVQVDRDGRMWSKESMSMRTFEGGTKFIESL